MSMTASPTLTALTVSERDSFLALKRLALTPATSPPASARGLKTEISTAPSPIVGRTTSKAFYVKATTLTIRQQIAIPALKVVSSVTELPTVLVIVTMHQILPSVEPVHFNLGAPSRRTSPK